MDRFERDELVENCTQCVSVFDRIWDCGGPYSQMTFYHRTGGFENCVNLMSDWVKCMKAKSKDGDEKNNIIKSMSIYQDRIKQFEFDDNIDILNNETFNDGVDGTRVDKNGNTILKGKSIVAKDIWELKNKPGWTGHK